MLYVLQAPRLQPVVHHHQLLVQLLQHLLAGYGLSACWGAAGRQQRTSKLLLPHPLGCPRLHPLDPSLRHSPTRAPVRLSPQLVFISKGHHPSCNGGALLCVCMHASPIIDYYSLGSEHLQSVCSNYDASWDLALTESDS